MSNHRCSNCGRYPFCEKIVNANYCCSDWIELFGKCIDCLGCERLAEDENFKGTYRCIWRNNVDE